MPKPAGCAPSSPASPASAPFRPNPPPNSGGAPATFGTARPAAPAPRGASGALLAGCPPRPARMAEADRATPDPIGSALGAIASAGGVPNGHRLTVTRNSHRRNSGRSQSGGPTQGQQLYLLEHIGCPVAVQPQGAGQPDQLTSHLAPKPIPAATRPQGPRRHGLVRFSAVRWPPSRPLRIGPSHTPDSTRSNAQAAPSVPTPAREFSPPAWSHRFGPGLGRRDLGAPSSSAQRPEQSTWRNSSASWQSSTLDGFSVIGTGVLSRAFWTSSSTS